MPFFCNSREVEHRRKAPLLRTSDRTNGIICDQTIVLAGIQTNQLYPEHLRRIRFKDPETGKTLVFLTNQRMLPASTVCDLYKSRWYVELFRTLVKMDHDLARAGSLTRRLFVAANWRKLRREVPRTYRDADAVPVQRAVPARRAPRGHLVVIPGGHSQWGDAAYY